MEATVSVVVGVAAIAVAVLLTILLVVYKRRKKVQQNRCSFKLEAVQQCIILFLHSNIETTGKEEKTQDSELNQHVIPYVAKVVFFFSICPKEVYSLECSEGGCAKISDCEFL